MVAFAVFAMTSPAIREVQLFARFQGLLVLYFGDGYQRTVHRIFFGGDVHDAVFINGSTTPLCPSVGTRKKERTFIPERNKGLPGIGLANLGDDVVPICGKIIHVFFGKTLAGEGFGSQRNGLGKGCFLSLNF